MQRGRRVLIGLGIAVVVGLVGWVGAGLWIKRGVAEPAFEVLATEGGVEVRRYAPTILLTLR